MELKDLAKVNEHVSRLQLINKALNALPVTPQYCKLVVQPSLGVCTAHDVFVSTDSVSNLLQQERNFHEKELLALGVTGMVISEKTV